MARTESSVIVLEHSRVSLPPCFKSQPPLPLTFFDISWLPFPPVQRLFFYSYHHTTTHFMNKSLPNIKNSLSLTLEHFYPLAGTLSWPLESTKPIVSCCENNSSVSLTVAESSLIYSDLVGNHPRDVNDFFPLVPLLPSPNTEGEVEVPVMVLQVTLFPNTGICIGISTLHVIGDGKTTSSFMKSWASVCKSELGDTSCLLPESLPFYDRSVINDPTNLETLFLKEWATFGFNQQHFYVPKIFAVEVDKVRATFVLGRVEIQKLKGWILSLFHEKYRKDNTTQPPLHLSSFVVTCAIVWVCLIKVFASDQDFDEEEIDDLSFVFDCRERLDPPIPTTYFGNCLMPCPVDANRNALIGEDGIAIAAEAIGSQIQRMISQGVLAGGENVFTKTKYYMAKRRVLTIAGSPKLGVYGTDFGWGRPEKVEVVSIDVSTGAGAISLTDSRDGEGGVEIGMVLTKLQMDPFACLFKKTLSLVC